MTFEDKNLIKEVIRKLIEFTSSYEKKEVLEFNNTKYASQDGVLFDKTMKTLIQYPNGKDNMNYTIPPETTTLKTHCFYGSQFLNEVHISSNVSIIETNPFAYCQNIKRIEVSEDNLQFKSIDGALYNYNLDTLISYPIGNKSLSYTTLNSVKTISKHVFMGSRNLITLIVTSNVNSIEDEAFGYMETLEHVVLLGTTPLINVGDVFTETNTLKSVIAKTSFNGNYFGSESIIKLNELKCGSSVYYLYESSSKFVYMYGTGKMYEYDSFTGKNPTPFGTLGWGIETVIIDEGLSGTEISYYTFKNCGKLTRKGLLFAAP